MVKTVALPVAVVLAVLVVLALITSEGSPSAGDWTMVMLLTAAVGAGLTVANFRRRDRTR